MNVRKLFFKSFNLPVSVFIAFVAIIFNASAWANPKAMANAKSPNPAPQMLQNAGLDPARSAVWVGGVDGIASLSHRATEALNPASVMKLFTTAAALQTLGPQHVWTTQLDTVGSAHAPSRSLRGNLIIRGGGDPKLVVERLEAMLRQVREAGIDTIDGNIVLDRRLFAVPERDPGEFDGEPLRPYNARPDPLLINFKALVVYLKPEPSKGVAELRYEPPLDGVALPASVALNTAPNAACGDWRAKLDADFSNPNAVVFNGRYARNCGERVWPVAYSDAPSHSARAIAAMWALVGGKLTGQVISAPNNSPLLGPAAKPLLAYPSLPLSDVLRDVNKYSNNVMAQHVFLSLAPKNAQAPISLDDARNAALRFWAQALPGVSPPVLDNGSGLSREERISAVGVAKLLQFMQGSPHGALFADSLPAAGVDGTLGSLRGSSVQGLAQLKTGSLRDATALAGYFVDTQGKPSVFVALYNGPDAAKARLGMYCLLQRSVLGAATPEQGRNLCTATASKRKIRRPL